MKTEECAVAVIGLGSMGMGAARSCIRAGLHTYGIDINNEALKALKEFGAKGVSQDCRDFVGELDCILLLVVNSAQVKKILFENKLADQLRPGTAVMVSATISAGDAREIEVQLKKRGLLMLDAPVSGGAKRQY